MSELYDATLKDVLETLSHQRLKQLYKLIDQGELGSGDRVEALRRTVVQRLNGPRYQHIRRLWTQPFELFLTGDPALLYGAERPPDMLHRRDTGGLWSAASTMLIAGDVAQAQTEIGALIERYPVDTVMAGETAAAWQDKLYKGTLSGLRNLMRTVSRRNTFLQLANEGRKEELRQVGVTHRVPELGVEDLRQFLLILRAAPVLSPALTKTIEAAEAVAAARAENESAAETATPMAPGHAMQPVPETLEKMTRSAVRESARADLPDQAAALVPLASLYRWHWAEPAADAAAYLRSNGLASVRRAIARYLASNAHAQTHAVMLMLPEGVQQICPSDELHTAVDRQAHRLLEAASAYRKFAKTLPRALRREIRSEVHNRVVTLAKRYAPRLEALVEADIDSKDAPADHEARVWLFGALANLIVALMVEGSSTRRLRPWRRYMSKRLHFALNRTFQREGNYLPRLYQAARIYNYAQAGGVDTAGWFRTDKPGLLDITRLGLLHVGPEAYRERNLLAALVDTIVAELDDLDPYSAKGRELQEILERARDAGLASPMPLTHAEKKAANRATP